MPKPQATMLSLLISAQTGGWWHPSYRTAYPRSISQVVYLITPALLLLHSYSLGLDARETRKRRLRAWKELSRATETRIWSVEQKEVRNRMPSSRPHHNLKSTSREPILCCLQTEAIFPRWNCTNTLSTSLEHTLVLPHVCHLSPSYPN